MIKTFEEFIKTNQPKTLSESYMFYKDRLIETDNPNKQVMSKYTVFRHNKYMPMLVEKITIERIINKHGINGLICISAYRSDCTYEENENNTKHLLNDLIKSPYRYLPVYGGYRDDLMNEKESFEPSYLVFNYNTKGDPQNWEDLKKFGIELCGKYNQSSVLVKSPGEPPVWLNRDGVKISDEETDVVFKNDPKQEYFTSLKSLIDSDKFITSILWKNYVRLCKKQGLKQYDENEFEDYKKKHWLDTPVSGRFTYDMKMGNMSECYYVNPSPTDLNEQRMRDSSGEILIVLETIES